MWCNQSVLIDIVPRTSWDEDDPMPSRRSSWDLPTPVAGQPDGDWLERSSRRGTDKSDRKQRHDETPRPTPTHKYNSWARDRKKTGATPVPGRGKWWDMLPVWQTKMDGHQCSEVIYHTQKCVTVKWLTVSRGIIFSSILLVILCCHTSESTLNSQIFNEALFAIIL